MNSILNALNKISELFKCLSFKSSCCGDNDIMNIEIHNEPKSKNIRKRKIKLNHCLDYESEIIPIDKTECLNY